MARLKPCAKPGCPNLASRQYCGDHISEAAIGRRRYDDQRGNATDRGYDSRWRRTRETVLRRDTYLCQHCANQGRTAAATEVHHLIPVKQSPERMHDAANLLSVCHSCHLTLEEQVRRVKV